MRPIVEACFSVNHTAPSAPEVRPRMLPVATGTGYSTALTVEATAEICGIPMAVATVMTARKATFKDRRDKASHLGRIRGMRRRSDRLDAGAFLNS
jgi:hypothetical protein